MRLREQYDVVTDGYLEFYRDRLDKWGLKPRPPLDVRAVAVMFTAAVEGYGLRQVVDPDSVSQIEDAAGRRWSPLQALALLALFPMMFQPTEDSDRWEESSDLFELAQELLIASDRKRDDR